MVSTDSVNLHIVLNDFKNDSRVLKETKSIEDAAIFNKVAIAALWDVGLEEHVGLGNYREVWRVPLKTRKLPKGLFCQAIKYIEWTTRICFSYARQNVKVVHCHDLSALPVGVLFKIMKNSKVVYDAHELETERHGQYGVRKRLSKIVERSLFPYADCCIVVSDSIAAWYKREYRIRESDRLYIIRNIPYKADYQKKKSITLKSKYGIRSDELLFIYQGALATGHGLEMLLEAFAETGADKHIVFMGYGALESTIKRYADKHRNIHFHEAVSFADIPYYTSSADVGISLIENTCLSYYYCLPNKCFEYLLSGLPIIVSNFPDMAGLVGRKECGWTVVPCKFEFMDLVNNLSQPEIDAKKMNVAKHCAEFGWEDEQATLCKIYNCR